MSKMNVFLKNKSSWGLINQTYKFGEDRMTHHKFIKLAKKVLRKLINFTEKFLEKS